MQKENTSPKVSIVISTYNRAELFERTIWHMMNNKPSCSFELIVVDDGSTEDLVSILKKYTSQCQIHFVSVDTCKFEEETGIKKYWNNPALTNNIGVRMISSGKYIFLQGNEVIVTDNAYDMMLKDKPKSNYWMVMSTTYDMPKDIIDLMDVYGANLTPAMIQHCLKWPLQSIHYRSDVTNYLSLTPKTTWVYISGYDERYLGGISAEDSDFVRRCRMLPDFKQVISEAVTLHQYHGGKTKYYEPIGVTEEFFKEGCKINHKIFNAWDNTYFNRQEWEWGQLGVERILDVNKNEEIDINYK